jgi:hypothetical protein
MEDVDVHILPKAIWSIFRSFGIVYGTLEHFVVLWYIFHVLIYCTTKNLAILVRSRSYDF